MAKRISLSFLLILLGIIPATAQFYSSGNDPGNLKWSSVDSPNYRIIYPCGLDSLAGVYARNLEFYRDAVSWSSGMVPGQAYKSRTPVILHAFTAQSNGSVSWAPKTVDLYTVPNPFTPEPTPWIPSLVVHESRHISQMQGGYRGWFKPLGWLLGEMVPGAVAGLYPSTYFLEGDAVVAETALSYSGRGRRASFLNYYMAAWDSGDMRNWHRWRWGSYRLYAPDHYALGYVTIAGTRYFYDDPLFTSSYFRSISRRPLRPFHIRKQIRAASGMNFRNSFGGIMEGWRDIWEEEAAARAPFIPEEQFTEPSKWFVSYEGLEEGYSLRSGLRESTALWTVDPDGKARRLRPFSSATSQIRSDGSRIYWSEVIPSPRWSLAMTSRIRYMDPSESLKIHDITKEGRYYNPAPDGDRIAAVRYPVEGGSFVDILDLEGRTVSSFRAPGDIQVAEPVWSGGRIYVTGVSFEGTGIYEAGSFKTVLPPRMVTIDNLSDRDGRIVFVSDRTGVGEVYELDPSDGSVFQLTSTRYGVSNPSFEGDTLYFTSLRPGGEHVYRTTSVLHRPIDFSEVHHDRIADALTAQEKRLAQYNVWSEEAPDVPLSQPRPYRKGLSIINIHSWAPVYMSPDVSTSDLESATDEASLGATALFQNVLGTASGSMGYSYRPGLGHGGHFDIEYRGLFPVIHATVRTLDRHALEYGRQSSEPGNSGQLRTIAVKRGRIAFESRLNVSVPLSFTSGGWTRGIVPQAEWSFGNDRFSKGIIYVPESTATAADIIRSLRDAGPMVHSHTVQASVRGYSMTSTAPSGVFPRLGIGAEAGFRARLGITDLYTSSAYLAFYGYLPGIVPQQGLRLQVAGQHLFGHDNAIGENLIITRPRGFDTVVNRFLAANVTDQVKLSADYAIPVWVGDISFLSPFLYIKNFLVTPHADCTLLLKDKKEQGGNLISVGADLEAVAANFLWLPFDCSFGLRIGINGGAAYKRLVEDGYDTGRAYISGLFSISL